ncbi:non-specific lipid-transfer protein-like protein At2g13820 [Phalaenopsis equestris]|uniref:non-specific lipid-transfer protein-like protein At2g13820 n=1 Tax=Phalaenopsis equestris TaxID=78828 RepID=UPI0009E2A791|nr:non-specific lipid-transfer protein-like protein At2g13820 [Phalaenopsis equestris]
MARQATMILVATTIIVVYQSVSTNAQTGCTRAIISLSPCLSYISGNSSTPSASCCSQLGIIVKSQPLCLCTVLNGGGSSIGISINKTRALALPGACQIQTPPVSQCNGSGGPTASPAKSPESPSIPAAGAAPSANGSKSNGGYTSNNRSKKSVVFIMLSIVISAYIFQS